MYFSREALNAAIITALEEHNDAPLRGMNYSRQQQFDDIEKSALLPLRRLRYELKKHQYATVAKNGHAGLSADKHYYSVPYRFIGKKVKLLYSRHSVEIYYKYECIAPHQRTKSPYQYKTQKEHMASTHRFISE